MDGTYDGSSSNVCKRAICIYIFPILHRFRDLVKHLKHEAALNDYNLLAAQRHGDMGPAYRTTEIIPPPAPTSSSRPPHVVSPPGKNSWMSGTAPISSSSASYQGAGYAVAGGGYGGVPGEGAGSVDDRSGGGARDADNSDGVSALIASLHEFFVCFYFSSVVVYRIFFLYTAVRKRRQKQNILC